MSPIAQQHLEVAQSYLDREARGDLAVIDEVMTDDVILASDALAVVDAIIAKGMRTILRQ